MDVYMLSNPLFCRARFITINYRKEIDFRKMAASLFYFYTETGRSISKTCWLEQSLLCYVPMATGKSTTFVFFPKFACLYLKKY